MSDTGNDPLHWSELPPQPAPRWPPFDEAEWTADMNRRWAGYFAEERERQYAEQHAPLLRSIAGTARLALFALGLAVLALGVAIYGVVR